MLLLDILLPDPFPGIDVSLIMLCNDAHRELLQQLENLHLVQNFPQVFDNLHSSIDDFYMILYDFLTFDKCSQW